MNRFAALSLLIIKLSMTLDCAYALTVSTSTVVSLPPPIYDIKCVDRQLIVLASTGEGIKIESTSTLLPVPGLYAVDAAETTATLYRTFSQEVFPTDFAILDPTQKTLILNNTNGGLALLKLEGDHNAQLSSLQHKGLSDFAYSPSSSHCLAATDRGDLILYEIIYPADQASSNALPQLKELHRLSTGFKANFGVALIEESRFAVSSGPEVLVVDSKNGKIEVKHQHALERTPTNYGFQYPVLFMKTGRKGQLAYLKGEHTITFLSPELRPTKSITFKHLMPHVSCGHEGIVAVGGLYGDIALIDSTDPLWTGLVSNASIRSVECAGSNLFYIGDEEGQIIRLELSR